MGYNLLIHVPQKPKKLKLGMDEWLHPTVLFLLVLILMLV